VGKRNGKQTKKTKKINLVFFKKSLGEKKKKKKKMKKNEKKKKSELKNK